MQLSLPPVEVKPVHSGPVTASPRSGERLNRIRLTALLADACGEAISDKDAALTQGYSPAYWSMCKSGEKNTQLDPVAELPPDVQAKFLTLWAAQLGLEIVSHQRKHMARARLLEAMAEAIAVEG